MRSLSLQIISPLPAPPRRTRITIDPRPTPIETEAIAGLSWSRAISAGLERYFAMILKTREGAEPRVRMYRAGVTGGLVGTVSERRASSIRLRVDIAGKAEDVEIVDYH
jgi:hypothetical protein